MIEKLLLTPGTTFQDAVRLLDKGGVGILPVVDSENKLLGIITDGDIRRAILKGEPSLEAALNRNPRTVPDSMPRHDILKLLREQHYRHMPVLTSKGQLKEVVLLDGLYVEDQPNKVIIMAGGMGTRLGELTKDVPKPMLPVGGKPVLERIIRAFSEAGYRQFILCLNYKAEVIENYFGDGASFNVSIEYTREHQRMGTAGAISLIDKSSISAPFFVINGDVLTQIDYLDYMQGHIQSGALASMAVKKYEEFIPYACVHFDDSTGELQQLREKPRNVHYINAGVYILTPECLPFIPADSFYDMPTLFETLLKEKMKVKVYKMDDHWIDIGYPGDYKRADHHYAANDDKTS